MGRARTTTRRTSTSLPAGAAGSGATRTQGGCALVDSLDQAGRGVARVDGKVVFIDGALPGERVEFRYRRRRGRFDEADVTRVLDASPERVAPRCPHFALCGGCSLQHLEAEAQVRFKQNVLAEQLLHLGGVVPASWLPPLTGPRWGYRRRARLGGRFVAKKGGLLLGFREKATNRLADLTRCDVLEPRIGAHLAALRVLLGGLSVAARVPQIEVAVGDDAAALVVRHLQPLTAADRDLLRACGERFDLQIHTQAGGPDSIQPLAAGTPPPLRYAVDGGAVTLQFGPTDFTQVNAVVNQAMIARTLELLALRPDDRVLDLYCGLGNFTLPIARRAGTVVGIEGDSGLVARARANARLNGIHNAEFHAADLTRVEVAQSWLTRGWDALLLDPPRTGAAALVGLLGSPYPERLVYVSCNPATLARDLGVLVRAHGYRLESAGIIDMFPHTSHVESIALLVRPPA